MYYSGYFRQPRRSGPTIEVSEEKFIQLMVEDGKTEAEARLQLRLTQGLGSSVYIDGKFYKSVCTKEV